MFGWRDLFSAQTLSDPTLLGQPLTDAVLGGLLQAHLFHGTTEEAIVSICRHGFDPEHASFRTAGGGGGGGAPKMFGLGLYLASNATKSAQVR